jgi:hypothetical protein
MKKIFVAIVAVVALCACSSDPVYLNYRGLSMGLPFKTFCDSLMARGFAVDSAHSDSAMTNVVMVKPGELYHLVMAQQNDTIKMIQESYQLSTNDSTRNLWQQIRDETEKELGTWPNMPKRGDDHKVAKFETDGGFITITLMNTYKPTLTVLYQQK